MKNYCVWLTVHRIVAKPCCHAWLEAGALGPMAKMVVGTENREADSKARKSIEMLKREPAKG